MLKNGNTCILCFIFKVSKKKEGKKKNFFFFLSLYKCLSDKEIFFTYDTIFMRNNSTLPLAPETPTSNL